MRVPRTLRALPLPLLLLCSGCGYVHLGKQTPATEAVVLGDEQLLKQNSDLKLEKKMLQQELALTRAQGDALRMAIENRAADGDTSRRLTEKLSETTRELALLRANYAKLQADKDQASAAAADTTALQARLGAAEEKLATSLRTYTELQEEVVRLRTEVDRSRAENVALGEQVKTVTAQNEQAQAALAQLNTQLLAQKDARAHAEQDAETLRTQLQAAAPNGSALAQQRSGSAPEARSLAAEHAAEVADLKQQLDALRSKLGTLETERTQLKQALGAAGAAPADLANVEAKLATALRTSTALQDENAHLKLADRQLAATKGELENELARLKAAPAAGQVQSLRDQLREAQVQASALSEENSKLKSQLASARPGSAGSPAAESTPLEKPVVRATSAEPPNRIDLNDPGAVTIKKTSSVNATLMTSVPGGKGTGGARPDPVLAPGQRVHVVAGGDTLSKISQLYYGTPTRWGEILAANRDILGENNNLIIGRTLRIP